MELVRIIMAVMMPATTRPTNNAAMSVLVSRRRRYGCHRGNSHFPSRSVIITISRSGFIVSIPFLLQNPGQIKQTGLIANFGKVFAKIR
jgi:hypothetical protein